MAPDPPLVRLGARARGLLRPWALTVVLEALVLGAAAFAVGALIIGAWPAAAFGTATFVTAACAVRYLRALNRELNAARRMRADWERRYLSLHQSVAVGVFRADRDARLTAANRAFVSMLGYRSEHELIAAEFAQHGYVGPGTFEAVLARVRAQGALEDLEMRLRRFDGLTVTALANVQAVWDEAGEAVSFEGTLLDVTRERLAESQRRSMERRYRRLFDSSAVGMLVGNLRRGTIEEANPALIALFGLRASELPAPLERVIPADQRRLHRSLRAALEVDGMAGPVTCEYLRGDGVRIPVLLSAALVEPQHGEFVAVLIDRSAEVDAVRSARQLEAACAPLIAVAPLPVAAFERERGLTSANAALCEWLGLAEVPYGSSLEDLLGPGCPEQVVLDAARALSGETVETAVDAGRAGRAMRFALTLAPCCAAGDAAPRYLAIFRPSGPAAASPVTQSVTAVTRAPDVDRAAGRRSA